MFEGTVFNCQNQLSRMVKLNKQCESTDADQLAGLINKFATKEFIPVEYAEKILTSIGNLMERCTPEAGLRNFASCTAFTTALTKIVVDFECRVRPGFTQNISSSSFSSHLSYELTLFMLLGMLDNSPILTLFMKHADEDSIPSLMKSLSQIIIFDHLYLTQVMLSVHTI